MTARFDLDAVRQPCDVTIVDVALELDDVRLRHLAFGLQQRVGAFAVVRQQHEAF